MNILFNLITYIQRPLLVTACTIFHQPLSWGDLVGSLTGIVNVYLMTRQNIWAWPMGIINVIIYALLLPHAGLLANGILQVIYFMQSIYGWYIWERDRKLQANKALSQQKDPDLGTYSPVYQINRVTRSQWIILILIGMSLGLIIIALLDKYAPSDTIFFDGSLTAASLVTTYMETKKYLESWILWIIIDTIYIPVYIQQNLYFTSIFSAVLVGLAVYGLISWLMQLKTQKYVNQ